MKLQYNQFVVAFIALCIATVCWQALDRIRPPSQRNARALDKSADLMAVDCKDIPRKVAITGKLGRPLGELVTIRGRWTAPTRSKPGGPVFRVEEIDGKVLDAPVEFDRVSPILESKGHPTPQVGDAWEVRGVETGGFVGYSQQVSDELRRIYPHLRPSSPLPSGFLTHFAFLKAQVVKQMDSK